jgi:spermidine synthase
MALQKAPHVQVTIVDADSLVVDFCRTHLGQRVFDHSQVALRIEDAVHYLRRNGSGPPPPVHGVVCDLTDSPIGAPDQDAFEAFFEEIFRLSFDRLAPDGWISVQAGASYPAEPYVHSAKILSSLLMKRFRNVQRSDLFIPSYGEPCAFLFARK